MDILRLENIVKQYATHRALDGVNFTVPEQSIFGMLGPNGAGKTTTIRIITSILIQDSGDVFFQGKKLERNHIASIGYMPEERGMYKKMKVWEQLVYLAQLKDMSAQDAKRKVFDWMERMQMKEWWNKRIEELSKGMQQKVQFVATVVHEPKLIILDEPFSGLDPINSNIIKEEIERLRNNGATIIFSTHRMEQVEEICERIVLVNKGKIILDGEMNEVKQEYKQNLFSVTGNHFNGLSEDVFTINKRMENSLVVKINSNHSTNDVLQSLMRQGVQVSGFEEILPSLNDIFIQRVEQSNHA
jgi:ABC-2 type transport system ATP-binding protein